MKKSAMPEDYKEPDGEHPAVSTLMPDTTFLVIKTPANALFTVTSKKRVMGPQAPVALSCGRPVQCVQWTHALNRP